MTATAIMASAGLGTPETYLDTAARRRASRQPLRRATTHYSGVERPRR